MSRNLTEYECFWAELARDGLLAVELLDQRKSPSARRFYIRTLFSTIEAWVHWYKVRILEHADSESIHLTVGERALLEEKTYDVQDGAPRERPKYIRPADNIRFMFGTAAKVFNADYELPLSEHGWECLRNAIEVRNRVTHPKELEDLEVSEQDVQDAREGSDWFHCQVAALVNSYRP